MSEHDAQLGTFRGIQYNKWWLKFGGQLAVIGLVILFLLKPRPETWVSRTVAGMLGFGILAVIYSLSPAMGQLMSGDRSWDDLSTKEQLIQLTKWSIIGAIVLMIVGPILYWLVAMIV